MYKNATFSYVFIKKMDPLKIVLEFTLDPKSGQKWPFLAFFDEPRGCSIPSGSLDDRVCFTEMVSD